MPENECAAWCSLPDHYVVCDLDLKHSPGFQTHLDSLIAEKRLLQFHEPLRGLELFAGKLILQITCNMIFRRKIGAGGFGTGLAQSGYIKTLWAIEWDEPAATTYRSVKRCGVFHY
jgi:hypothetical protein